MNTDELKHFLDEEGRLTSWPAKTKKQMSALQYLAKKLEWDRQYTEPEINELLTKFHTFEDPALLRRELYMKHFLDRKTDCSAYWKTARLIPKEWKTERLIIRDSQQSEADELQKIYDECAYIGDLTGYHDERKNPIQDELDHVALPPNGKPELHRIQSILEKKTKGMIGYLIVYHGFPDPDTFWIALFAIRPTFHRQKFGTELILALTEEAKMLGTYERLGLGVGVGNDAAMQFWSSCGFTDVIKIENHGTHTDEWRVKQL